MSDLYAIDSTKLHLHPQRVAQWLDAGDDIDKLMEVAPLYVEISPVGQCNHRCTFCSVDYIGYERRQLKTDFIEYRLREMGKMGVKSVMFAGEGEPLLHQSIGHLSRFAKQCGMDVAFTTNATALKPELAEEILPNTTWLKASVNAGSRDTYSKVHQTKPHDFDRVIANLGEAVQIRNRNGWQCTLGAQMVLIPENVHEAGKLAALCKEIGLDYLVLKPYSQNPNSQETATRGFEKLHFGIWQLDDTARAYSRDGFEVIYRAKTIANLSHERQYEACHSTPFMWAYIMATGDVYGCSAHLLDQRFCFGNINHQSFAEIWHSEKRRECVKMMRDFDLSSCRRNCRMEACNQYLWQLKHPAAHVNFI